jgi:hypothetical protein
VSVGHPLMRAIADVPADHLRRIQLKGLSAVGIERLANAHARRIPNLYAITNGNPFLATELLRGHEGDLSDSLRDSMLSRLQRLSPKAREVAELVSVVPDRTERGLLDQAVPANTGSLQSASIVRTLVVDHEHVRYRPRACARGGRRIPAGNHAPRPSCAGARGAGRKGNRREDTLTPGASCRCSGRCGERASIRAARWR